MKHTAERKKIDALTASVETLVELFRDTVERSRLSEDDDGNYGVCLNKGDGEIVITAMIRRADNGGIDLGHVLDDRRVAAWRETASRHSELRDEDLRAAATRLRRSAKAASSEVIAMLEVHDDAFDEAVSALTNPETARVLPKIGLDVEDELRSYWLKVRMTGRPRTEGLEYIKRVFEGLDRAKCLIVALAAPAHCPDGVPMAYAVFDK